MLQTLQKIHARQTHLVIGLMSGTSADGVDAALCELSGQGRGGLKVRLVAEYAQSYSPELRERILNACQSPNAGSAEICALNFLLGKIFAEAALRVIARAGVDRNAVDCIGSHGQTISHLPPRQKGSGFRVQGSGFNNIVESQNFKPGTRNPEPGTRIFGATLQIGEPAVIAERTGIPVVSNFRARDMAAGGQGAPLVPFVDFLLFSHETKSRVALNIGGIANLTWLPARGTEEQVVAYDTGPGNMLIDAIVQRLTDGRQAFDASGALAASGKVNADFLAEMMKHPFLKRPPPKSTGREDFGAAYALSLLERGRGLGLADEDIAATVTAFTARTVACEVRGLKADELIVAGGGALNGALMAMLGRELPGVEVATSDAYGIPVKAKESIAFAILARETMLGHPANLPSATGAAGPRVLGNVTFADGSPTARPTPA